eukprot:g15683.t1
MAPVPVAAAFSVVIQPFCARRRLAPCGCLWIFLWIFLWTETGSVRAAGPWMPLLGHQLQQQQAAPDHRTSPVYSTGALPASPWRSSSAAAAATATFPPACSGPAVPQVVQDTAGLVNLNLNARLHPYNGNLLHRPVEEVGQENPISETSRGGPSHEDGQGSSARSSAFASRLAVASPISRHLGAEQLQSQLQSPRGELVRGPLGDELGSSARCILSIAQGCSAQAAQMILGDPKVVTRALKYNDDENEDTVMELPDARGLGASFGSSMSLVSLLSAASVPTETSPRNASSDDASFCDYESGEDIKSVAVWGGYGSGIRAIRVWYDGGHQNRHRKAALRASEWRHPLRCAANASENSFPLVYGGKPARNVTKLNLEAGEKITLVEVVAPHENSKQHAGGASHGLSTAPVAGMWRPGQEFRPMAMATSSSGSSAQMRNEDLFVGEKWRNSSSDPSNSSCAVNDPGASGLSWQQDFAVRGVSFTTNTGRRVYAGCRPEDIDGEGVTTYAGEDEREHLKVFRFFNSVNGFDEQLEINGFHGHFGPDPDGAMHGLGVCYRTLTPEGQERDE